LTGKKVVPRAEECKTDRQRLSAGSTGEQGKSIIFASHVMNFVDSPMKVRFFAGLAVAFVLGVGPSAADSSSAQVTEKVNDVEKSPQGTTVYTPAEQGTLVHDGEQVKTGAKSRAELILPSTTIARMGSNTIYNFSAGSNTVDLQEGDILFCKPKNGQTLTIKTAAVTAGITGTTGFVSVQGGRKKVYILGIIEGHATASADNHPFLLGPGDILEFTPSSRPFLFAYDLPRFVHSSSLLKNFKGTLPNQSYIDREVAKYQEDVSRGFITPPSHAIDYSGDIPIYDTPVYANQGTQPANNNPQSGRSQPSSFQLGGSSNPSKGP
jgi:FecR protein